jgi:uncharacterized membrane protein YphA (DoxX/SURF4 family)
VTRTLLALCRLVTAALFLYAASTKVPDMAKFAEEVANYRLLPAAIVPAAAAIVVGLEIVAGLALLAGGAVARAASIITTGMMLMFIAGLSQALLRGIDLSCGCFGGDEAATWATVGRDVLMLLPTLAVTVFGPGKLLPARDPAADGRPAEAP